MKSYFSTITPSTALCDYLDTAADWMGAAIQEHVHWTIYTANAAHGQARRLLMSLKYEHCWECNFRACVGGIAGADMSDRNAVLRRRRSALWQSMEILRMIFPCTSENNSGQHAKWRETFALVEEPKASHITSDIRHCIT